MICFFKSNKPTTTDIGRYGEDVAAKHLKEKGFRILARNRHEGRNEIDIIAENREFIVFVEVKARKATGSYTYDYGAPADAVTPAKRRRTVEAARAYLYKSKTEKAPRFDVIEVYLGDTSLTNNPAILRIEHLEDAFRE